MEKFTLKNLSLSLPVKIENCNLYFLNKVLIIILISLAISLVFYGITHSKQADVKISLNQISGQAILGKPLADFKELSFYTDMVKRRNLFSALASSSAQKVSIKDAASGKGLRINGIYQEGSHFEAMVEDTEEKKTYFIKPQDLIKGCTVKRITAEKVVLQCAAEEMELL